MPHEKSKMDLTYLLANYSEVGPLYGFGTEYSYSRRFPGRTIAVTHIMRGDKEETSSCRLYLDEVSENDTKAYMEIRGADLSDMKLIEEKLDMVWCIIMDVHKKIRSAQ